VPDVNHALQEAIMRIAKLSIAALRAAKLSIPAIVLGLTLTTWSVAQALPTAQLNYTQLTVHGDGAPSNATYNIFWTSSALNSSALLLDHQPFGTATILGLDLNPQYIITWNVPDGSGCTVTPTHATSDVGGEASVTISGATMTLTLETGKGNYDAYATYDCPDTVAPDTTITSRPELFTSSNTASFAFTGTDNVAVTGFECQLDSGSFEACTSPKAYSALAVGPHTFQVRAKDAKGNVDTTPASFGWTVDTTPPDTSISAKPTDPSNSSAASFTFSGDDAVTPAGNLSFECKLDAGGFAACTSAKSYTGLADGPHTFEVRATDAASNTDATPASVTWTVDTTPPGLTVPRSNVIQEATGSSGAVVSFTTSASDAIDSAPVVTCTPASGGSFTLGTTNVSCTARDAATNTSAAKTFDVVVRDTTAPTLTVPGSPITTDASGVSGATVSFSVSATDAVTATPSIVCTASGAKTGVVTSGATFAIGSTTVSCTATDGATNASTAKTFTVTVRGAGDQLAALLAKVRDVVQDAPTRSNLVSIVQNAQSSVAKGDTAGTCDKLTSFISQVRAQSDKKIAKAPADGLLVDARRITAVLGCA
jgi:hypothetical protein